MVVRRKPHIIALTPVGFSVLSFPPCTGQLYTTIQRTHSSPCSFDAMRCLTITLILTYVCRTAIVMAESTVDVSAVATPASEESSATLKSPGSATEVPRPTHTITVGAADHKFRPDVTQAEIGDVSGIHVQRQDEGKANRDNSSSSSNSSPSITAS